MSNKSLLILRHGKAEAHDASRDKERNLELRGEHDAKAMGELIKENNVIPDLVVSSNAVRARQTAEFAAKAAGYKKEIDFRPEIYDATITTLIKTVQSLPDSATSVLLVGHNPGLSDLAGFLINADVSLPTAGLIHLNLDTEWRTITVGCAKIAAQYSPKTV